MPQFLFNFSGFKHAKRPYDAVFICLYLDSLILYRKVFVLQTELLVPPFKGNKSQPSSMFVAREMKQKLLHIVFRHIVTLFWNIVKIMEIWDTLSKVDKAPTVFLFMFSQLIVH